ncbi:hypothetical protein OG216_45785 (plasmid) [Streptomycetaceae bacterium NBC_01309]
MEIDTGYVSLTYDQEGLHCLGPTQLDGIRWQVEPLRMGRSRFSDEWLELAPFEDTDSPIELPLRVAEITGWFGLGSYDQAFALAFRDRSREIVVCTTDDFDLVLSAREPAVLRAEFLARAMQQRLVREAISL